MNYLRQKQNTAKILPLGIARGDALRFANENSHLIS